LAARQHAVSGVEGRKCQLPVLRDLFVPLLFGGGGFLLRLPYALNFRFMTRPQSPGHV
jgi:hypothetical protein